MSGFIRPGANPGTSSARADLSEADADVLVAAGEPGRRISLVHWDAGNASYKDVRLTILSGPEGGPLEVVKGPYAVGAFSNTGINMSGARLADLPRGHGLYVRIDKDVDGEDESFSFNANIVFIG